METENIKKYLQVYLDEVIIPELNSEFVGKDDQPISITIDNIMHGIINPNRISFILHMEPDLTKSTITSKINLDLSRFVNMLGIEKNLHVYWNKRPLH
jgi:hypothetical protein